jgi:hypothetical protein
MANCAGDFEPSSLVVQHTKIYSVVRIDTGAQYTRLFMMVKLFQLKVNNGWSDDTFKDMLTLVKDMLPQGNTVPKPFMRQNL